MGSWRKLTGLARRAAMLAMALNDLIKGMLAEIGKVAQSSTVVGKVRDAGGTKVVPLSKVSVAFGTGVAGLDGKRSAGDGDSDAGMQGSGAGGALVVEPRAFVVVDENGVSHMLALKGKRAELRHGVEIGAAALPEAESTTRGPAPQLTEGKRPKK
jgi:uncharacterized spore protein YtfJ